MAKLIDRRNHHLVMEFLAYEQRLRQLSPESVRRYESYMKHLLLWAMDVPLSKAHTVEPSLISYLSSKVSVKSGNDLSRESWRKILGLSTRFFIWERNEYPKEFAELTQHWIDSLRIPKSIDQSDDREVVHLEEVQALIQVISENGDLSLLRSQAAAAFLFASGIRAGAFVTLPIEAVDIGKGSVKQLKQLGVRTKNGRSAQTPLLQIPDLTLVIKRWDSLVRSQLPPFAPWFALIHNEWGYQRLIGNAPGKGRQHQLNQDLRRLFRMAGLPYKSAHKFRRGFVTFTFKQAKTLQDFKAISLTVMHRSLNITDQYYAKFSDEDTREIIRNLTAADGEVTGRDQPEVDEDAALIAEFLRFRQTRSKGANYPQG